jgi:hypothetical protein
MGAEAAFGVPVTSELRIGSPARIGVAAYSLAAVSAAIVG